MLDLNGNSSAPSWTGGKQPDIHIQLWSFRANVFKLAILFILAMLAEVYCYHKPQHCTDELVHGRPYKA